MAESAPPGFEPVQPVRLYERIVEQVEAAIASGELAPGQRLPSERELVVQFGTSRATVREALRVLESNGIVRSRPGDPHGPEVLPFTSRALVKQLRRLTHADELSLAQLLASRMMLEAAATRLAAALRTDAQLAAMDAAIEQMRAALEVGHEPFSEADVAFHEAVAEASGNLMIQVCNEVVRDTVLTLIAERIARAGNRAALMRHSLEAHVQVLDAIREGDGQRASAVSLRNLYDYYSGYVPASDRVALHALLEA